MAAGRAIRRAGAALAALALAALAPAAPAAAAEPPAAASGCETRADGVFVIRGQLDAAMAACVAARLSPGVRELIVSSEGGEVTAALDIAERLRGRALTVRVRRACNSSCANYLIPVARRLVVEPGAVILLHGGADPAFLRKVQRQKAELIAASRADGASAAEAERRYRSLIADTETNVARQRAFIAAEGVRPGWLIYRTAEQPANPAGLVGETDPPLDQARVILVEERLLRSCLPRLTVEPFQADLERQLADPGRTARLKRLGAVRSAGLRCAAGPAT